MKSRVRLITALCAAMFRMPQTLWATQTENHVLRILPTSGSAKIDGKVTEWDLSGGIFACDDAERFRDQFSVWFFAMYDNENLYLFAKSRDPTPLNNEQSGKGGHGFAGDCLQVRFITGYGKPNEMVSHWMGWQDRDKASILSTQYARDFKGLALDNSMALGAQQAFEVDPDKQGYSQEIAIPWKLLTADGQPPHAGDAVRMAIEPNYTAGPPWGRINIHDIFRDGVVPDRVFTFRAYAQWGEGVLQKEGHLAPASVRLSDEREFPVKLADGGPVVDWTGLIQAHELPGFKTLSFTAPVDGDVSLNIQNEKGEVVRQLLTENTYQQGTHDVKWDGLTSPHYKTPGQPVEPGTYKWSAITHPPFKLTLRGWADNGGSSPWENGPTSHWGGDHGVPKAVAIDDKRVYLGWSFSEAGHGLLACDLAGNVVWKVGTGLGNSSEDLAVDGDVLYSLGNWDSISKRQVIRLRTSDGVFDNWEGRTSAAIEIPELWADKPDKALWPNAADGMDVKKGMLYLSFSDQRFRVDDVTDWKAFATKLHDGQPLDRRILGMIDGRTTTRIKEFVSGKLPQQQFLQGNPRFDREALKTLNELLVVTDLVPNAASLSPAARAEANRTFLQKNFESSISALKTNMIAVCDAKTGKLIKTVAAPYPQAVHVIGDNQIAFVSDASSLMTVDLQSGVSKVLVKDLDGVTNFSSDSTGKIYACVAGTDQQIKMFSPNGQPAGTIGKQGGRKLLGPWQPDGVYSPSAIAIDTKSNHLWVMEADFYPKRVSVWDISDGQLVKHFFGAAHYGASGGAINPLDPNIMVGVGCEWRIDPATGKSVCTGVFDRATHGYAVYCPASNGKLYLATIFEVMHNKSGLRIFERLGEGEYIRRAEWRPDYDAQTTAVWSDVNGDGKEDADEVTTLPFTVQLHGSNTWSANINSTDFTLFGGVMSAKAAPFLAAAALGVPANEVKTKAAEAEKVYRFNPAGFTACGAPKWDLDKRQSLAFAWSDALQSAGFGMLPSKDNRLLVTCEAEDFRCYDLASGKLIWSYPNPFYQVHGSHLAPPPVPGVTRGAYGLIGTFTTPQTGTVWVINGNCGEWYLLTEKGYYLGHLFQSDVMKMHYPDSAKPGADLTNAPSGSGGEDFGGSVNQAADGKVYIEAGKTGFWNLQLTGLDQITPIAGGTVEIRPEDIVLARAQREAQLQVASGSKLATIARLTPTLTGDLAKDFKSQPTLSFQKGADASVRATATWDEQTLYLGWDVTENTPWTNGATAPAQMYLAGDTVDFQFAADPRANSKRSEAAEGDLRLSIGNLQGKPAAVIYRAVSAQKKPMGFTSGVIAHYEMDYVDVVPDVQATVKMRPDKKGYIVEAGVPWSAIGVVPEVGLKYRADLGATFGNEAGSRTRLRTYWSNQETGLVDDAVFELKMTPRNWGDFVFQK